jgi:hypothetical protein
MRLHARLTLRALRFPSLVVACALPPLAACGSDDGSGGGADSATTTPGADSGGGDGGVSGHDGGAIVDVALPDVGAEASTDPIGVRSPAGFFHPGVIVTLGGLNSIRNRLVSGDPDLIAGLSAIERAVGDATLPKCPSEDSAGRCVVPAAPSPPASHVTVTCGSHSAAPPGDTSCDDEKAEALAAYTHALLWYLKQDESEAQKAIRFLDAWSNVTSHVGYQGSDNSPLQCGWTGTLWARAAELIRYTYPQSQYTQGWSDTQAKAFGDMLTRAIRPYVAPDRTQGGEIQNGNWQLSEADAFLQISVYNDNMADYQQAAHNFLSAIRYYFYLTSDGATPNAGSDVLTCKKNNKPTSGCGVDYWWGIAAASGLVDGTCQETCRDLEHVQYGLGAATNAAETAAIQGISGVDLYGDTTVHAGKRIFAAMEFHAALLAGRSNFDTQSDGGNPGMSLVPAPSMAYSCDGTNGFTQSSTSSSPALIAPVDFGATRRSGYPVQPTWETGYNHFVNVENTPMPKTLALLAATSTFKGNRPTLASHPLAWETLTKLGTGKTGFPQ